MALDPNEILSQGTWEPGVNGKDEVPDGVALPDGVENTNKYYAQYKVYRDGHREVKWYKRGTGDGKSDPVITTTTDSLPTIKQKFDEDVIKEKAAGRAEAGGVTQEGATRGPQTGPTREVYRGGQWVVETNPTYQAPATTPHTEGTPIYGPDGNATGYDNTKPITVNRDAQGKQIGTAVPLTGEALANWERDQNEAAGRGRYTNAEVAQQQQTTSDAKPVEGYPGWTVKTTKVGNDTKTVYINPQGQEASDPHPNPNAPKPVSDGNGGWGYWDTTQPGAPKWTAVSGGPQDEQKPVQINGQYGVWKPGTNGAAPTWVPIQGGPNVGPDNPTAPAPAMPTIVVGASQAALQEYYKKLQEGVSAKLWSQKWASDRWAEAVQTANVAVQEAATQQREAESTRNATINLAQDKATLGQNAITTALSSVDKLNGYLPAGSPLGGQSFAALLGIEMLMQARSGIDGINPAAKTAPVPSITTADLASPSAIEAKRAEIAAHPASPTNAQPSPASVPAAASAPTPAPTPAPDMRNSSDMDLPPGTPAAAPVPPPDARNSSDMDVPTGPGTAAAQSTPYTPPTVQGVPTINPATGEPTGLTPQRSDPNAVVTTPTPDYGQPGMSVRPDPNVAPSVPAPYNPDTDPSQPRLGSNDLTRAPQAKPSEWPVLNQYQPTTTPLQPPIAAAQPQQPSQWPVLDQYGPASTPPPPAPTDFSQHAQVIGARVRAVPPWQLSPQEIEQARAAGIPESEIWSVPGRSAA